jgi:hypothetical protein
MQFKTYEEVINDLKQTKATQEEARANTKKIIDIQQVKEV